MGYAQWSLKICMEVGIHVKLQTKFQLKVNRSLIFQRQINTQKMQH